MVGKVVNLEKIIVKFEIELDSKEYLEKLGLKAEANDLSVDLGSGVIAKVDDVETGLGFMESTNVSLLLSFSVGVGSGVVGNLIYNAIGAGIRQISVNGRRVRPDKEELVRALQTAIDLIKESEK